MSFINISKHLVMTSNKVFFVHLIKLTPFRLQICMLYMIYRWIGDDKCVMIDGYLKDHFLTTL